jgi:hypothetical protein
MYIQMNTYHTFVYTHEYVSMYGDTYEYACLYISIQIIYEHIHMNMDVCMHIQMNRHRACIFG